MSTHPFSFYRIGADPEYLLIQNLRGSPRVFNAQAFMADQTRDRIFPGLVGEGLKSFIGHDGHPATGEFRPPPTRNVAKMLMYLGTAITQLKSRLPHNVDICASPFILGEPLGGHIHVSFLSRLPEALYLRDNRALFDDGMITTGEREIGGTIAKVLRDIQFIDRVRFSRVLSRLIRPFEESVQPALQRQSREQRYGGNDYDVRQGNFPSPFPDAHMVTFEYRRASTWLIHPDVAFCYLGLAKLAALNFVYLQDNPGTSVRELLDKKNVSNDLRTITSKMDKCLQNRDKWFQLSLVNYKEWEKFAVL